MISNFKKVKITKSQIRSRNIYKINSLDFSILGQINGIYS